MKPSPGLKSSKNTIASGSSWPFIVRSRRPAVKLLPSAVSESEKNAKVAAAAITTAANIAAILNKIFELIIFSPRKNPHKMRGFYIHQKRDVNSNLGRIHLYNFRLNLIVQTEK